MERPSYGYSSEENPDPQAPPACPRHPDRVSYVRCKRCERPACPDCQRAAAVGMLCVDCERELSREQAASRPRNAMGGSMGQRKPYVTYTVIALCVLAYAGQYFLPQIFFQLGAFSPFRITAMPWTFLTGGFLHGGIVHLLINMYGLWLFGPYLEQSMGHVRYAAVYLASVFGGHTAIYLIANPMSDVWYGVTVGASGGVFGLFAAMFVVNRRLGGQTRQIVLLIGLNLALTFFVANISWQGHLGGLITGGLLTAGMFALRPKATPGADRQALAKRSALLHGAVVAGVVILCLMLIGAKLLTTLTLLR